MHEVRLGADLDAALGEVPGCAGVGQIVGADAAILITGHAANLRRWAALHLGAGPAPRKGVRPRTNLRPIAAAIRAIPTSSGFLQRRVFERLMAPLVPLRARRDLKPPYYLQLDPHERFPRLRIVSTPAGDDAYGPFRNRDAAAKAAAALQKLFPLRPCDYVFEPDPGLALGQGCLYAQVRSCAAPCLERVSEAEYRELALQTQTLLSAAGSRPDVAGLRPWVAQASTRALVVERGSAGIELHPVQDGAVLDEAACIGVAPEALEAASSALRFEATGEPRDDRAWLCAWLHARHSGHYLVLAADEPASQIAARVRDCLAGKPA